MMWHPSTVSNFHFLFVKIIDIKSGPLIKKGQKNLKKIIHDLNYK
jgi:hypothetical protein